MGAFVRHGLGVMICVGGLCAGSTLLAVESAPARSVVDITKSANANGPDLANRCPALVAPSLADCQNPRIKLCPTETKKRCETLLGDELVRQERGMPRSTVLAPESWRADATAPGGRGFDRMPAVSEQAIEPGIPDFNSYASLQRFSLESLAAGARYAGLIQNLRRGWEANGNRVTSCWEYAYEDNYTVSRALDSFAMAGNSPEAIYDIAFARGGVASGRGDLSVAARDGSRRGLQGILSYRREYPLGPVDESGVHAEANHSHKNAFNDAVYLAPVLAMFVDGAGGQGAPFLSKYLFNAIAQHQAWQDQLNLNFHASVPGSLAQKRRRYAAILEDGSEIWQGYHDEELNELFLKQQEFSNLLQTFIQKARHSRFFKLDAAPGGVYALAKLWYPQNPQGARSSGLVTASVQFTPPARVFPDRLLWGNNAPQGGSFPNIRPVQDAQRNSFRNFMTSPTAVDRELKGLLFEIIAILESPAAADCIGLEDGYDACDWSKALFAERLQSVLINAEYVPETYPGRPAGSHHVIAFPGTAEDEYQQCLRVSPNPYGMAALNQQLNEAGANPVPPFCAAGGQAIEDGGRAGWRAKAAYDTAGECAGIRGVFYATPRLDLNNDAGASSTQLRQKLMELEYYRQAKVVWEREKVSAKLLTVDPAMIAADGRFQLPKVQQGGRSSYGSRSFAAIDFDYGFNWSLEGGPAKSFCEFKPSISVHAGSSVYLLGHSVDIIDYKVSLSSKRKVRVGEILGHELYQPADENLNGRGGHFNVVAEGSYSDSVEHGQTLLIGPIPIDLRMGVTGTLQLSGDLSLDHGGDLAGDACSGQVPTVTLTGSFGPRVKLDAFASAGVGGEIFGVGASAGVRGDLTLVDLALNGGLLATISSPSDGSALLAVDNRYGMVFQSMNGSISAYLRIAYLVDSVTWRKKLVGWDGYSLTPSWSTQFSGVELGDLKQALGGQ